MSVISPVWPAIKNRPTGVVKDNQRMDLATKTSCSASRDRQGPAFPHHSQSWLTHPQWNPASSAEENVPSFLRPPRSPLLPAPVPDFRKECPYYKLEEQRACPFLGQAFFFFLRFVFPYIISPSSHYTFMWIFLKNIFLTIFKIDNPQGCPV